MYGQVKRLEIRRRQRKVREIQADVRSFSRSNAKLAQALQFVRDRNGPERSLRQKAKLCALGIRFALRSGLVQTTAVDKLFIYRRNVRFDKVLVSVP